MKNLVAILVLVLAGCAASTSGPSTEEPSANWCSLEINSWTAYCFTEREDCEAFGDSRMCTASKCYLRGENLPGGYIGRDPAWPRAEGDVCTQVASCNRAPATACRQMATTR